MIGAEVSLPTSPPSRRRIRGYVAELDGEDWMVQLYPAGDGLIENTPYVTVSPGDARVLSDRTPSGWHAVQLISESDEPICSLRLSTAIFRDYQRMARDRGVSFEHCLVEALEEQLERWIECQ